MLKSTQQNKLIKVCIDIFLLLITPIILGPGAAVLFFFFYPLTVILFVTGIKNIQSDTKDAIGYAFLVLSHIARFALGFLTLASLLNTNITLPQYVGLLDLYHEPNFTSIWSFAFHVVNQLSTIILLIKTYNSYFSYKYQTEKIENQIGVYTLEFYIFILAYICVIIFLQFLISL